MVIYLFVLFLIVLIFKSIRHQKRALFISFIILALLSSLRKYTVGVDTLQFYNNYINIGSIESWDYSLFRFEPGFFYLCRILNIFSKNPQTLIIVSSVFINFSVYRFIKKHSKNYFYSFLIYFLFNIYFSSMNTLREWLAISILLFAYDFLIDKSYFKYCILLIASIMFHNAAWAGLLMIPLVMFGEKKYTYQIIVISSIVLFVLYGQFYDFISTIFGYQDYTSKFLESNYFGSVLVFLESLIILLAYYVYVFKYYRFSYLKDDKEFYLLLGVSLIYLCFLAMVIRMNIFNRISGVYEIFLLIIIPKMADVIKMRNKRKAQLIYMFTVCTIFVSFLVLNLLRPEWLGCIPYEFFWI